jgi:hypothetical protein
VFTDEDIYRSYLLAQCPRWMRYHRAFTSYFYEESPGAKGFNKGFSVTRGPGTTACRFDPDKINGKAAAVWLDDRRNAKKGAKGPRYRWLKYRTERMREWHNGPGQRASHR